MDKWGSHPATYALEPVNEPQWGTPSDSLKDFYRSARKIVHSVNPDTKFVFHDSFHFDPSYWNDLFDQDDYTNVVMDHHYYQAWYGRNEDIQTYCDSYGTEAAIAENLYMDVWIGEWSLATDTCAMWLGGFNNGGDSVFECKQVDCPYSYLSDSFAVDFDRTASSLGPYGESAGKII